MSRANTRRIRYAFLVGRRMCEVTIRLANSRSYTAVVEAESAYAAVLAFQKHCNDVPPELARPRIDYECIVEVKPIYKVSIRKAMIRAVENQARAGRNKPQSSRATNRSKQKSTDQYY